MDIKINCTFKDSKKELRHLLITDEDIKDLIVKKAKELGQKGYEGKAFNRFDEKIQSIEVVGNV